MYRGGQEKGRHEEGDERKLSGEEGKDMQMSSAKTPAKTLSLSPVVLLALSFSPLFLPSCLSRCNGNVAGQWWSVNDMVASQSVRRDKEVEGIKRREGEGGKGGWYRDGKGGDSRERR